MLILPLQILKQLNLHSDSLLDLSIKKDQIIFARANKKMTLKQVLIQSPKEKLTFKEEDYAWEQAKIVGKEI